MRATRRSFRGVGLALLAFFTLTAETLALDEKELECEQAVAHLASCCDGFDRHAVNCTYTACSSTPASAPPASTSS